MEQVQHELLFRAKCRSGVEKSIGISLQIARAGFFTTFVLVRTRNHFGRNDNVRDSPNLYTLNKIRPKPIFNNPETSSYTLAITHILHLYRKFTIR